MWALRLKATIAIEEKLKHFVVADRLPQMASKLHTRRFTGASHVPSPGYRGVS